MMNKTIMLIDLRNLCLSSNKYEEFIKNLNIYLKFLDNLNLVIRHDSVILRI